MSAPEPTLPTPPLGEPPLVRYAAMGLGLGLFALAGYTLGQLWPTIVMAVWTAALLDGVTGWIARHAGGRRSVGAAGAMVLLLTLLAPAGIMAASVLGEAFAFAHQLLASPAARVALEQVVSPGAVPAPSAMGLRQWSDLAQQHGQTALRAAQSVAGASGAALLAVVVFLVGVYEFLVRGREHWRWVQAHAPCSRATSSRLAAAFLETGRGVIFGAGLSAAAQALLASGLYLALGLPRVLVLSALTFVCAFLPVFGTAFVWAPLAVGLVLKGQLARATVLVVVGLVGISSVDNLLRPSLQRWGGNLKLSSFLLLLAAFGGLAAFGTKGLLLGPLVLRLSRELLDLAHERAMVPPADGDEAERRG